MKAMLCVDEHSRFKVINKARGECTYNDVRILPAEERCDSPYLRLVLADVKYLPVSVAQVIP